jgi:hypothetical protein
MDILVSEGSSSFLSRCVGNKAFIELYRHRLEGVRVRIFVNDNLADEQVKKNGRVLNLGGKCSVPVEPGDLFRLQTPGGGGWGHKASLTLCFSF